MAGIAVADYTGEDLQEKPWFRATMGREDAERYLKGREQGDFVVRHSSRADSFALSYNNKRGSVTHSLVQRTADGFKLPDGTRVFPTLGGLLRTCRFLRWDGAVDDKALAQLQEMFPEEKVDELAKVLARARNDVDTAIDMMLSRQQPDKIHVGAAAARGGAAGAGVPASAAASAAATEPIATNFLRISAFSVSAAEVADGWRTLEGKVTRGVSRTLQENLFKILSQKDHPMGKKVHMFTMAFNLSHGREPGSPSEGAQQAKAALSELKTFFAETRQSVAGKVAELNTTAGSLMIWRAVERVTLAQCHGTIVNLLRFTHMRHQERSMPAFAALRGAGVPQIADATVKAVGIDGMDTRVERARLVSESELAPAVEALAALGTAESVDLGLGLLVRAVHSLDDAAQRVGGGLGAGATALFPLVIAALARADVPDLHARVDLLSALIPSSVACGQEGLALAAVAAAIEWAERVATAAADLPQALPGFNPRAGAPEPLAMHHNPSLAPSAVAAAAAAAAATAPTIGEAPPPVNPASLVDFSTPSAPADDDDDVLPSYGSATGANEAAAAAAPAAPPSYNPFL